MESEMKGLQSVAEQQEKIFAPFTPDEEQPYIFISYAHKDRERVFPILTRLYEKGWRIWYDEGIPIGNGADYLNSLAKHIVESVIVIAFVTKESVQRKFVTEKELEFACGDADKQIVFCFLDEEVELPLSIKLLTAKRDKYPYSDEASLEKVLEGIEGLMRTEPREAKGFEVKSGGHEVIVAEGEDKYEFQTCDGGVRLTKYKGSEEHVIIPEMYQGQPVVEIAELFLGANNGRTVIIPPTVKLIGGWTFVNWDWQTNVYIPTSVQSIDKYAFANYRDVYCFVHCAEGTYAHSFAEKTDNLIVVLDESMNVTKTIKNKASEKYAFCSYSDDIKEEAKRIIDGLAEKGCCAVSSCSLSDKEKKSSYRNAECLIAFLSKGYIEDEIDFLYRAISEKKKYVIYALDDTPLPSDMVITISSEQQLRYDTGTYEDRLKKLVNLLVDSGCVKSSVEIPNYEYTTDTNGNIILTKYIGSDTDVVVPDIYAGHKIVEMRRTFYESDNIRTVVIPDGVKCIGEWAFCGCVNLTAVSIPDSIISIGDNAFSGCSSLTSITIPDGVAEIGENSFYNCDNITNILIPESVTIIGKKALALCNNLREINVSPHNKNFCTVDGVLFSKDLKTLISFPLF